MTNTTLTTTSTQLLLPDKNKMRKKDIGQKTQL